MTEEPTAEIRTAEIPQDTLAARLMLARLHAGNLTISQAAEKCALLRESWSNWERGMKPRDEVDVVERVSAGLGVDRNWLAFGGPLAREIRRRTDRRQMADRLTDDLMSPADRPRSWSHIQAAHGTDRPPSRRQKVDQADGGSVHTPSDLRPSRRPVRLHRGVAR